MSKTYEQGWQDCFEQMRTLYLQAGKIMKGVEKKAKESGYEFVETEQKESKANGKSSSVASRKQGRPVPKDSKDTGPVVTAKRRGRPPTKQSSATPT